jgi:hypothetical protein
MAADANILSDRGRSEVSQSEFFMNRERRKGLLMVIGGLILGGGYHLYVLREIESRPAELSAVGQE